MTLAKFSSGARRFVLGLGKKVLLADALSVPADEIFALSPELLNVPVSWFGVACYTLQIYLDFSAYSDMAIGLGRMFGFEIRENFKYPYVATSITQFWRRWHISLSSWFRDYLYIPLGGNRVPTARLCVNLVAVFALCGFWHGASWNFIAWKLFHGAFLVVERLAGQRWRAGFGVFGNVYTLVVVMASWVLFRSPTLSHAVEYLGAMAGLGAASTTLTHVGLYWNHVVALALAFGVVVSVPVMPALIRWWDSAVTRTSERPRLVAAAGVAASVVFPGIVLFLAAMQMAAGTHQPFIYFRF